MRINRSVGALFRMGEAWINRELAGAGIPSAGAYLLLELADEDRLNLTELGRRVGVDRAYITRMARLLADNGYVERLPDPDDGRGALLGITGKGRAAARKAEDAILSWVAVITDGIDDADIAVTGRTIDRFYANATKRLDRRR